MLAALVRRFAAALATAVVATGLLLALLALAPGDPLSGLPEGSEIRAQLSQQLGLNQPVWVRWLEHLGRILSLDFGTSWVYRPGAPVTEVIARPALVSLALVGCASLLTAASGSALALATSARGARGRLVIQAVSLVPAFLLAYTSVTAINAAVWWAMGEGLIARPSWFALPDQPSVVRNLLAVFVLGVGSGTLSEVHGELEDALARITRAPWVDAARARGQATWPLVLRAFAPDLVASMAARAPRLVGGVVVVEKLLLLNGAGAILWEAATLRDYELALSIGVLAAALVAAIRLAADGLRIVLVPKLREVSR